MKKHFEKNLKNFVMGKYFTIDELCYSDVAKINKITNKPNPQTLKNLKELITFLDKLREAWGSPIKVTSGYRCPKLNKLVKGSKTSAHLTGYAADLWPMNDKIDEFKQFVTEYLQAEMFDQCIRETSKTAEWVHIGLYNNKHEQRRQIFDMNV